MRKKTKVSTWLAVASLTALLAIGALLYLKARAAEAALAREGLYSGMGYPDDAKAPQPRTFTEFSKPAALVAETIAPVHVVRNAAHHVTADFGRAAFGALQFTPLTGGHVRVRLGEALAADGTVLQNRPQDGSRGIGAAFFERDMVLTPGVPQRIEGPPRPRPIGRDLPDGLTSVFPFRYAEIEGIDADAASIAQIAVHYPFSPEASAFRSSDPALNRVWDFSAYSVAATSYAGLYLDGNRERTPYEADAYINQLSNYVLDSDYRLARHTLEYLLANPTWPTEWMMFPILMAHNDFLYSGDTKFLRHIYPSLKKHVLTELARPDGLISTRGPEAQRLSRALGLASPMADIIDWPASERDGYAMARVEAPRFAKLTASYGFNRLLEAVSGLAGFHNARLYYEESAENAASERYRLADVNTVVNAFHYASLTRMVALARALGESNDANRYNAAAGKVRAAMLRVFYDSRTGLFVDAEGSTHSSVHANMFPLAFGLVPPEKRGRIADFLASKGMAVSVYGAQFLLDALYGNGKPEAALALMTADNARSWLGMMTYTGSTITTEAWNASVKPNQDWNHAWGASPLNIIARWVMGVRPIDPGFAQFAISPQPGPLKEAHIQIPTLKGRIGVSFSRDGDRFRLVCQIPPDTRADIALPANVIGVNFGHLTVNGRDQPVRKVGDLLSVGQLGPGEVVVEATR